VFTSTIKKDKLSRLTTEESFDYKRPELNLNNNAKESNTNTTNNTNNTNYTPNSINYNEIYNSQKYYEAVLKFIDNFRFVIFILLAYFMYDQSKLKLFK